MSIKVDLTYPHNYELEEMVELAPQPGEEEHLYFPGASHAGGHDGVLARVTPSTSGPAWTGTFAFRDNFPKAVTAVYACPDPESLCVIAKGSGYIVNSKAPHIWQAIEIYPILDVRAIARKELLIFAGFTRISA